MSGRIIAAALCVIIATSFTLTLPADSNGQAPTKLGPNKLRAIDRVTLPELVVVAQPPRVKVGQEVVVIATAFKKRMKKNVGPLADHSVSISMWPGRFSGPDPDGSSTKSGKTNAKGVFVAKFRTTEVGVYKVEATLFYGKRDEQNMPAGRIKRTATVQVVR
jgi:hypothetical protein